MIDSAMSQQKILLLGGNGQVGYELVRYLVHCKKLWIVARTIPVLANSKQVEWIHLDLADQKQLLSLIKQLKPSIIINAAAYTAVDSAEQEMTACRLINQNLPCVLANTCKKIAAKLIHFSTDYVFDGKKKTPYVENDQTKPVNQYGLSKLMSEQFIQQSGCCHLIVRTSWVYSHRNTNFLLTILRLAHQKNELTVVDDQFGTPTWARMLAYFVALNILKLRGILHLSAKGNTNWYEFALTIINDAKKLDILTKTPNVVPIKSNDYGFIANRPAYSVLDCSLFEKRTGMLLPDWKLNLFLCLQDIKNLNLTT